MTTCERDVRERETREREREGVFERGKEMEAGAAAVQRVVPVLDTHGNASSSSGGAVSYEEEAAVRLEFELAANEALRSVNLIHGDAEGGTQQQHVWVLVCIDIFSSRWTA